MLPFDSKTMGDTSFRFNFVATPAPGNPTAGCGLQPQEPASVPTREVMVDQVSLCPLLTAVLCGLLTHTVANYECFPGQCSPWHICQHPHISPSPCC